MNQTSALQLTGAQAGPWSHSSLLGEHRNDPAELLLRSSL